MKVFIMLEGRIEILMKMFEMEIKSILDMLAS